MLDFYLVSKPTANIVINVQGTRSGGAFNAKEMEGGCSNASNLAIYAIVLDLDLGKLNLHVEGHGGGTLVFVNLCAAEVTAAHADDLLLEEPIAIGVIQILE